MAVVAHHPVVVHLEGVSVSLFAIDIDDSVFHFKFVVFIKTFTRFLVSGIIGILMSCAILLPVLIVFLGNGRSDVARNTEVLFDSLYYTTLYSRFMSFSLAGAWTITGFIPLVVVSLLLLFNVNLIF